MDICAALFGDKISPHIVIYHMCSLVKIIKDLHISTPYRQISPRLG